MREYLIFWPSLMDFWLLLRVRGKLFKGFKQRSDIFWKRPFWSLYGHQSVEGIREEAERLVRRKLQ